MTGRELTMMFCSTVDNTKAKEEDKGLAYKISERRKDSLRTVCMAFWSK